MSSTVVSDRSYNQASMADAEPRRCALPLGMANCDCAQRRYRKIVCGAVSDEINFEGPAELSFL
jgi:hypothetical protein